LLITLLFTYVEKEIAEIKDAHIIFS